MIAAQLTARFPNGMSSLAILLHVEQQTGSYGAAGLVLAATSVGPIAAMVDAARAASRVISTVTTLAATIAALWRALCGPLVVYASVVLVLLGASLAALGTGLHHLAYRRVYS